MPNAEDRTDTMSAEERAEREEMFSFHPDILTQTPPLPRRMDGSPYRADDN